MGHRRSILIDGDFLESFWQAEPGGSRTQSGREGHDHYQQTIHGGWRAGSAYTDRAGQQVDKSEMP